MQKPNASFAGYTYSAVRRQRMNAIAGSPGIRPQTMDMLATETRLLEESVAG